MKDQTTTETITEECNEALLFCQECVTGYMMKLEQRYGFTKEEGRQALNFSESGKMRAMSIIGYIVGLAEAGHTKIANKFAHDLQEQFDNLASYGGTFEHTNPYGQTYKWPTYTVELSDDGTRHGFSVLWFKNVTKEYYDQRTQDAPARGRTQRFGWDKFYYVLTMNGGLLYHGPRSNATAVTLDNHLWSLHT